MSSYPTEWKYKFAWLPTKIKDKWVWLRKYRTRLIIISSDLSDANSTLSVYYEEELV